MRKLAVLDAPSNLGLRMPKPGVVPGCHKLAGALRDQGLVERLGATDAGCVVPPRYDISDWQPGDGAINADALAAYTVTLADRIEERRAAGDFPIVLGGDCSILLGIMLGLRRAGRYGVAYLDGSSDFRHVGNTDPGKVGATAGEGVALITGRGQPDLVDIEGRTPYVQESDIVVLGVRDYDEGLAELAGLGIPVWTTPAIRDAGPTEIARRTLAHLGAARSAEQHAHEHHATEEHRVDELIDGFWVHFDVDVLDPEVMPAVDAPDPGGLDYPESIELLWHLIRDPLCVGMNITIFDPDLDPDGALAAKLTDNLVAALTGP